MRKNCIQNIVVHIPDNMDFVGLSNKVNEFHFDVIERRLNSSILTTEEKISVIDGILKDMKLREINGIIE